MNDKNLKKFTKENAKENGAKGGRASGEAKREKKRIKDFISDFLDMEAPSTDTILEEYNLEYYTNAAVIATRLLNRAKRGDIQAIKLLLELTNENENECKEVYEAAYNKGANEARTAIYKYMTYEELCTFLERMEKGEKPQNNNFLTLPDGRIIYGEDELK